MASFDSLRNAKRKKSPLYNYLTVPDSPLKLSIQQIAQDIKIQWIPPYNNGGHPIIETVIVVQPGNLRQTSTTNSTIYVGLSTNINYTVSIVARNIIGSSLPVTSSFTVNSNNGSLLFNGSNQYLTYSGVTVGSQAFTIEGWFQVLYDNGARNVIVGAQYVGSATRGLSVAILNPTTINIDTLGVSQLSYTVPTVSMGAWYHFAMVRNESNVETLFLNGVRSSTGTNVDATVYAVSPHIGGWDPYDGVSSCFGGLLSNIRIVIGSTVYDPTQTTITVPTGPLTNITGTALLLNTANGANYLADGSDNHYTMVDTNGVVSSSLNPF
jgi:hypothetical protein